MKWYSLSKKTRYFHCKTLKKYTMKCYPLIRRWNNILIERKWNDAILVRLWDANFLVKIWNDIVLVRRQDDNFLVRRRNGTPLVTRCNDALILGTEENTLSVSVNSKPLRKTVSLV